MSTGKLLPGQLTGVEPQRTRAKKEEELKRKEDK
jgi:hypothetical protein